MTSVFYGAYASKSEVALRGPTKGIVWKSDHPKEWFETFGEDSFLDDEFEIEQTMTAAGCLIWHDLDLYDGASKDQLIRATAERDMGLFVGFTVTTPTLCPGNLGAVGVSMGELSPDEFDRIWREKQQEILAVCGLLDMGMREQHLRSVVDLSARQEECLVWLAAGLVPEQISDRLTISKKTIEHHISKAKDKLNASTRDHAVAKALMLNLIKP